MIEYSYKLYKDSNDQLVVTVKPLMLDIEKSIETMMNIPTDDLSDDNKHMFEMKILGLRTIHQFMGALLQEQLFKETKDELKGKVNISTNQMIDDIQVHTVH